MGSGWGIDVHDGEVSGGRKQFDGKSPTGPRSIAGLNVEVVRARRISAGAPGEGGRTGGFGRHSRPARLGLLVGVGEAQGDGHPGGGGPVVACCNGYCHRFPQHRRLRAPIDAHDAGTGRPGRKRGWWGRDSSRRGSGNSPTAGATTTGATAASATATGTRTRRRRGQPELQMRRDFPLGCVAFGLECSHQVMPSDAVIGCFPGEGYAHRLPGSDIG